MATEGKYEGLIRALKMANTPETRQQAAKALSDYLATRTQHSKPVLVSLGLNQGYPNAIPLSQAPTVLAQNAAFYDIFQRVVAR